MTSTHNSLVVSYTAAIRYTSNMAAVTVVDRMTSLSPNYIVLICIFFRLHFVKFSTFNLICTRESPPTTLPTFPAPEFFLEQPQSPQAITCRQIFHFSRLFWNWEKSNACRSTSSSLLINRMQSVMPSAQGHPKAPTPVTQNASRKSSAGTKK